MNDESEPTATGASQNPAHNSLIGRAKEFDGIQQLLAQPDCRLVTLIGPGGIGKTRLALKLAAANHDRFSRGSVIVYLQPLRSSEFFVPAVADALGFSLSGQEPPLDQLGQYLSGRETLIVLDNFEHLLNAADLLSSLLPITPNVKYLVTSREALNLQEEWLYPINGLSFPDDEDGVGSVDQVEHHYDAVKLFAERAQRVYAEFSLDKEAEAVNRICRMVGGMPLALELAAAWRKTLSCKEIADEIQASLDFLTTRLRNISERHHSIQTVFDQTWQRLNKREQAVFKRLSVFRGGFQRDAVADVTGASLVILSTLVDKSLLRLDVDGRYSDPRTSTPVCC
jgi:predicted ATPase